MNATIGNGYVKYANGIRKWYKAEIERAFGRIRVSRRKFVRAHEAQEYRAHVLVRLARLRIGAPNAQD